MSNCKGKRVGKRYLGITAISALLTLTAIATGGRADDTATLLPNAIQYFMDANGKPLANGKVYMYTPSTTTPKTTWTTANKAVAQPQPFIPLGIAGKPANPIYGDGSYRQLVKDAAGNTIWDFNTSSTGGGSSPVVPTIGDGMAVGTILSYNGLVAPANYMFAAGQTVLRTSFPDLLNAITSTQSIICTAGTNIVSNFSDVSQFAAGMPIEVPCLAPGTQLSTFISSTAMTVTTNATVSGVFTAQVFPAGNGNGSTTFNLPDSRGRALAGRDNMNGTAANRLIAPYFDPTANGTGISRGGGSASRALLATNLPPYTPSGTITNGAITSIFTGSGSQQALGPGGGSEGFSTGSLGHSIPAGTVANTQAASTFAGNPQGGTGFAFGIVMPTLLTNAIIKVTPDALSSDATWQVPVNTLPVGRGTGTGFDFVSTNPSATPKFLQQSGDGTTATAPIWGTVQQYVSTNSISGLRGLTAGVSVVINVLGYYTPNDGGQGAFYWDATSAAADNGGTVIQPGSLPALGRWLRQVSGHRYNAKWFGAKGDCSTDDTVALASWVTVFTSDVVKGDGYLPAVDNCYLGNITISNKHGWAMTGDSVGNEATGGGSRIISVPANTSAVTVTGVDSGAISNFKIERIAAVSYGADRTIPAWNIFNALNFELNDLLGIGGVGMRVCCSANSVINQFTAYADKGLRVEGTIVPATTGNGPLTINSPNLSVQGSVAGATGPALEIIGANFATVINTPDLNCFNNVGTCPATVTIDGTTVGGGVPVGISDVTIIGGHTESEFSTTDNLGASIIVGKNVKAGNVHIINGIYTGAGNPPHYRRYWLQLYDATNVTVTGTQVTGLGNTAYDGGMIRIEAGYSGTFLGQNLNKQDITGPLYSDATSHCTGSSVNCSFGGSIIDTLVLGTPLPATSGGTGLASYVIGDLLYANSTTTLARLADAATTNALLAGGVGATPSWGKIGNSTLTNSSTTVNGVTCTLGSPCTVTASAGTITVGTTTVASGTSHGVLTNSAGVLGSTAAGTNGQLFLGVTGAEPNWGTMSGGASITNAGVVTVNTNANLTGAVTSVGNATSLGSFSSANLAAALTDETGFNSVVFSNTPSITTPALNGTVTGTGVASANTASTLVQRDGSGNFSAGTVTAALSGNATTATSATSATNATNGATVATTTNASFFPLFAASSTNSNQPFNLDSSLTYNPSTKTLAAVNFSGFASSASIATSATTTAITDDVATNATMYPTWVTTTSGNQAQKISSTLLSWNPSAAQLKIGAGADTPVASGTSLYMTNAGTTSLAVRDSTNDVEVIMLAASFGAIMGTDTNSPLLLRTNNTNQLTISGAGVFTFNTIPASDAATVDNTLCVSSTGVILKGSGTLGICLGTSSARYKHDIISMGAGLAEIARLSPKNFFYKKGWGDEGARLQYGFIAEDVVKVLPGVTAPDKDGKPNSVDMVAMIPVLVNAVKQLKSDNDNLRMDVLALQAKVGARK